MMSPAVSFPPNSVEGVSMHGKHLLRCGLCWKRSKSRQVDNLLNGLLNPTVVHYGFARAKKRNPLWSLNHSVWIIREL